MSGLSSSPTFFDFKFVRLPSAVDDVDLWPYHSAAVARTEIQVGYTKWNLLGLMLGEGVKVHGEECILPAGAHPSLCSLSFLSQRDGTSDVIWESNHMHTASNHHVFAADVKAPTGLASGDMGKAVWPLAAKGLKAGASMPVSICCLEKLILKASSADPALDLRACRTRPDADIDLATCVTKVRSACRALQGHACSLQPTCSAAASPPEPPGSLGLAAVSKAVLACLRGVFTLGSLSVSGWITSTCASPDEACTERSSGGEGPSSGTVPRGLDPATEEDLRGGSGQSEYTGLSSGAKGESSICRPAGNDHSWSACM